MEKVLILGANGNIAKFVAEEISDQVDLTLFLRNKTRLVDPKGTVIEGDATNVNDLQKAMEGQDIVYSNLGPKQMAKIATAVVQAAKNANVKRLIWVATAGIYNEYKPDHQADMEAQYGSTDDPTTYMGDEKVGAEIVEQSPLDTTIVRPNLLTNENQIQDFITTQKGQTIQGEPISRQTVAHFIAEIILNPETYVNQSVSVSKD